MSLLPRRALLFRTRLPAARAFSDAAVAEKAVVEAKAKWVANQAALEHHAHQTTDFWRKMSYYVCIPALAVFGTYVYNVEIEHKAHNQHLMDENNGTLPQPPRYDYLNIRRKPYPWGMNSLFFNPQTQRDMTIED